MAVKVFIDGTICDPEQASIPVFDRGFLYADSIYEVMRTSAGVPVDLDAHLDRLERSAAAIALDLPPRQHIVEAVEATLRAAHNDEAYVRLMVTRGGGEFGLDPALADKPRVVVIVRPLKLLPAEAYERGIKLVVVEPQRTPRPAMDPGVKSGNYLNHIMALHQARRAGADEALICDGQGRVAEGSTSNVFVVKGSTVITPALDVGLLAGITRERVIALARAHGMEVQEGLLQPDEVRGADEVFITSTIRGVVPVAQVDDARPSRPVVGPVTGRIMKLYERYLADHAAQ